MVAAFDGSLSDTQALSVTVIDVAEQPPVIASNGGGATAALSVPENQGAGVRVYGLTVGVRPASRRPRNGPALA